MINALNSFLNLCLHNMRVCTLNFKFSHLFHYNFRYDAFTFKCHYFAFNFKYFRVVLFWYPLNFLLYYKLSLGRQQGLQKRLYVTERRHNPEGRVLILHRPENVKMSRLAYCFILPAQNFIYALKILKTNFPKKSRISHSNKDMPMSAVDVLN